MTRGLIFDVDGTLVSLKVERERLRSTTSRELMRMGFDTSFMSKDDLYTQDIIDIARRRVESGEVKADFEVVRVSINKALDELELDWNAQAELLPDSHTVLSKLKASSMRLATLTNSGRVPADWLLRKHGLDVYFDFTLTRDEVAAMKPRADGMLKAIAMMGLPKDELMYVGDSVVDIRAAKAAGLRIVSVNTGRYAPARFRQEGSDYVVGSLSEVLELV